MKSYKVILLFDNLDNYMDTEDRASVSLDIKSDSYGHAYLLAERFSKLMDADRFNIEEG